MQLRVLGNDTKSWANYHNALTRIIELSAHCSELCPELNSLLNFKFFTAPIQCNTGFIMFYNIFLFSKLFFYLLNVMKLLSNVFRCHCYNSIY